ncbi:MAG: NUDIX domain-containing protein [Deltaproteobacteria bacterium]|nr:NUDIX domain-containing protein [Deltaproteobacteria bacterium]
MKKKRQSCTMLFLNPRGEVLMLLRDDKPDISYPNTWDLPGGHMEKGEGPHECICREMREELPGLDLGNFRKFQVVEFPERIDHLFWTRIDVKEETLNRILCEGQRAAWMSLGDIRRVKVASGFRDVLEAFFEKLERGLPD